MARTTRQQKGAKAQGAFEDQAVVVLATLQRAVATLLDSLPSRVGRAIEVQRSLGLESTLSWQVFRLASAETPLAAAAHVPKAAAMTRVLKAASKREVPKAALENTSRAYEQFERLVADHAGDRDTFDSMVVGLSGEQTEQIDLKYKRAAYRALSHFRGVRFKHGLFCKIFAPGTKKSTVDIVSIRGKLAFQRLRRDRPFVLMRTFVDPQNKPTRARVTREPIDVGSEWPESIGAMPEFCRPRFPTLRSVPTSDNGLEIQLMPDAQGSFGPQDIVTGHIERGFPSPFDPDGDPGLFLNVEAHYPAELMVHDVLLPDGLAPEPQTKVITYGAIGPSVDPRPESELLMVKESIKYIGRGIAAMRIPEVPRYQEMVEHALNRVGWDASSFRVYRCRVEYPIVPSSIELHFSFPSLAAAPR